ncbi:protein abrupt isoform X3 [Dendroctonus ponderosae]|uniref:BTB domain-containing protein n=1 Tax=Dendroctonus ponderosae TaxID=77166 RepID=A0AAR5QJG6_DENPD|nr:protein abrupt isoform X3 [Dendroctonus ponderosae]
MGAETPQNQQYSLRWNDFHSSIISSFGHLRDAEDFVDVTLACEGQSFEAHRVVLSACSPYFRELLKANPCQHPIIILWDIHRKDMDSLLRFMYNGEVNIGREQLKDFLKTAQTLQVKGLADVPLSKILATENNAPTSLSEQNISTSVSIPWSTDGLERNHDTSSSPNPKKKPKLSNNAVSSTGGNSRSSYGDNESILGQALEGGPSIIVKAKRNINSPTHHSRSNGDDSDGSDSGPSDHGDGEPITPKLEQEYQNMIDDHNIFHPNGSIMDPSRAPFPNIMGYQDYAALSGVMAGPSGMNGTPNDFASRRSMDLSRVRATDPRPCPKCGKIYRSAHTLRTHLEDKHTVCPGYRCVLCGTIAKSRNSLHSHMSRQHRGISTKDLPVLPMPSAFDPELASRLFAKAGIKISPAELLARSSPTGPRRSDVKLDAKSAYTGAASEGGSSICGDNDPEDLTVTHPRYGGFDYHSPASQINNFTSSRYNASAPAISAKIVDSLQNLSAEHYPAPLPPPVSSANMSGTGIIDTYLQLLADQNLYRGMALPDPGSAVSQAAKMAQLAVGKATQQKFIEKLHRQMLAAKNVGESIEQIIRNGTHTSLNNPVELEKEEADSSGAEDEDYSDEEIEPETETKPEPNNHVD